MDLWTPVVPVSQQHPNFKRASVASAEPEREVINGWAAGFSDRDGKFVREFQSSFNPSFWELYLYASFRELGFRTVLPKGRPDFLLATDEYEVAAEATVAQHPDGFLPEWDSQIPKADEVDLDALLDLAAIRLSNSLVSKHEKYLRAYRELDVVRDRPFVICLAPFEQPLFWLQRDRALRRVLYRYDAPIARTDAEKGEHVVFGHTWFDDAPKRADHSIKLGYFAEPGMEDVSAVVFSSCATWGKARALGTGGRPAVYEAFRYNEKGVIPHRVRQREGDYQETLLDGLHVYLNPFAQRPLPVDMFRGREVAIHGFDPQTGEYLPMVPDGFLFERCVLGVADRSDELYAVARGSEYRQNVPQWPERKLVPVGGAAFTFVDNHMAHHRGWTILIARDTVDDEWGAQAIPGQYRSVPSFVEANKRMEDPLVGAGWCSSKEAALKMIVAEIDKRVDGEE